MGATQRGDVGHRVLAYVVSAVLLGVTVWPVFWDPSRDSFPHSSYPMFSREMEDAQAEVTHALAVYADGLRVPLSPRLSAGAFEVLQSQATIRSAVRRGGEARARLCREAARRVAAEPGLAAVTGIELATSRYDVFRYFDGDPAPLRRRVHVACEVPRP